MESINKHQCWNKVIVTDRGIKCSFLNNIKLRTINISSFNSLFRGIEFFSCAKISLATAVGIKIHIHCDFVHQIDNKLNR